MSNMKFILCLFLVCLAGSYAATSDGMLPRNGGKNCEHCVSGGDVSVETQLKGAYLVIEKEVNISRYPDKRLNPFEGTPPSPPKVGQDESGSDSRVRSLDLNVGEVPHITPEPKRKPPIKIYDSILEDLSFPESAGSESVSEMEDPDDDDDDDDLVLTRLHLGGRMDLVSKRDENGELRFHNVKDLDLCCTNIDSKPETTTKVKPKTKLRKGKPSQETGRDCNCKDGASTSSFLSYDLLKLEAVDQGKYPDTLETEHTSKKDSLSTTDTGRVTRKLASNSECDECELCSKEKKCFYHNGKGASKRPTSSTSTSTSTTTTTTTTSTTSTTSAPTTTTPSAPILDEDKSPFVSDYASNEETSSQDEMNKPQAAEEEETKTVKDIDIQSLLRGMDNLVKMVKDNQDEQLKTQVELRKDRELLTRVILDIKDTKDTTQLYIQLVKIEMEIGLARQNIEQLNRDLQKAKSSSNLLTQYENQNNLELGAAKEKASKAEAPSPKLTRNINRLEKKKATIQGLQIDINKRIESLIKSISSAETQISELQIKKETIENILSKGSDEVDGKQ